MSTRTNWENHFKKIQNSSSTNTSSHSPNREEWQEHFKKVKQSATPAQENSQSSAANDRLHSLFNQTETKPAETKPQASALDKNAIISDYIPSATALTKDEYNRRKASNPSMPEFGSYDYFKNREETLRPMLEKSSNDNFFDLSQDENIEVANKYKENPAWTDDSALLEHSKKMYDTLTYHNNLLNEYKAVDAQLKKFDKNGVHFTSTGEVDVEGGKAEAEYAETRGKIIAAGTILTDNQMLGGFSGQLPAKEQKQYDEKGKIISSTDVEGEKVKAYDYYDKNKDNTYKNNPWGVFTGNYAVGKTHIKSADAGYTSFDATSEDIEASEVYDLLSERIQNRNKATFNNDAAYKAFLAPLAQYAPQAKDQMLHRTIGQIIGAAVGFASGGGVKTGIRIGGATAAANYMYKQTAGATFVRLLKESNLSVEDAKKLAMNEATVSSAIEFGIDYSLSKLWQGGNYVTKGSLSKATGKAAKATGDAVTSALKSIGISETGVKIILNTVKEAGKLTVHAIGEGSEEWIQTGVSITADEYAAKGKVPSAFELLTNSFDFSKYSDEELDSMNDSFKSGFLIGFVSGGLELGKSKGREYLKNKRTATKMAQSTDATVLGEEVIKANNPAFVTALIENGKKSSSPRTQEAAERVDAAISNGETPAASDVGTITKAAVTEDTASQAESSPVEAEQPSATESTPQTQTAAESEKTADTAGAENDFTDELDELQNTEIPTVEVGDTFVNSDTGNTIRVVSRGDKNTDVEIINGDKVTKRTFTNAQADTLAANDKYTKVENASAQTDTSEPATQQPIAVQEEKKLPEHFAKDENGKIQFKQNDISTAKPENATYRIVSIDGKSTKEVSGTVIGDYGIHKTVNGKYSVTLLKHGQSVAAFDTAKEAKSFAEYINKELNADGIEYTEMLSGDFKLFPNEAFRTFATKLNEIYKSKAYLKSSVGEIVDGKVPFKTKAELVEYLKAHIGSPVAVSYNGENAEVRTIESASTTTLETKKADGSVITTELKNIKFNDIGFDITYDTGTTASFDFVNVAKEDIANDGETSYNEDGTDVKEEDAIFSYKSSESYKINDALRSGRELTTDEKDFISRLDAQLKEVPLYTENNGKVYRNLTFDLQGQEAFDKFVALHNVGDIVRYPAYTSTSKVIDGYPVEGELLVHLEIYGVNGHDIAKGYGIKSEVEVLFERNSDFVVKSASVDGKVFNAVLEEAGYERRQIRPEVHESVRRGDSGRGQELDSSGNLGTMQSVQTSNSDDGTVQSVSGRNTEGDIRQRGEPQEPIQGGQRDTVRGEVESPTLNSNYKLIKTKHTKTGEDLWLVKLVNRVDEKKFDELKETVKSLAGYDSSFMRSFIFKEEPSADVVNKLNAALPENVSEDSADSVEVSAKTETTTAKEGNDNVHDGLLERPSQNDDAGRESEPVSETEEERNSGNEDRESREDVARASGELLQTAEEESSAAGQHDSGNRDDGVRESNDSEGDGAVGTSVNDNVDVTEGSTKSKDFVINKALAEEIDTAAPSMNDNIKAIETLHSIENSGKAPTKAQQGLLAKFKGWGGLANSFYGSNRSKLLELMSEAELRAAQGTVNDAYFTPTSIVDCVYKALSHLGFEGGNILEPSMGVGNFFGRMPKSVKDSSFLFGVEIDSISGRIAKQLYPSANIEIAPFQDVAYKDGSFDLIVGNVPFGEVKYKYKGKKYLIHDYFFVKAMDKLNDGGVLAFLTTKGTLDKLDSTARAELSNQGKFIGAYRLPSNVFSRSANANVVTDLIIIQKTADKGDNFVNLGSTEVNGETFSINEYFVKHPENIIGELVSKRDWRSGKTELDVKATGDVAEQLAKAIKKLPKNLLSGAQTVGNVDVTENTAAMQKFTTTESGDIEYIDSATGEVKQIKGKGAKVAKEYIELKNAYNELVEATLGEREASVIEGKRKILNTVYDKFVKNHGTLEKNKKVLSADNDFYKISGLEVYDTKTKKIVKSEMFTKDTLGKRKPKKADSALDALSISIGETGGVDLNRIASLTGLSESEVLKQLDDRIIYTPDGIYELNEVYLSGNVREKYEAVKGKEGFEKNAALLKAVLPEDIPAKNITPQFGAPWISASYVADFLKETLHFYQTPTVSYDHTTGTWSITSNTWGDNTLLTSKYGTKYIDAISLAEKALNMRQIVIRDKDKRVLVGETRAAQQKAEDIKAAFEEWCFKDANRRRDLVAIFNEKFNSNRNMDFSELAKYLTFDGLTDTFKLRDYQKRAVARAVFNGNTLLAHGVGTGKTAEMIAVAMELKRMGMAKKNMMVVPGHKVADFRNDILKMYPSAKVAMLEKGANPVQRQRFYALVASNDFDIVIIPHSSFGMLDVSTDTKVAFVNNQLAELEEVLTEAQLEKGKIDGRFIRQLENQKKSLEEKLKFVTESEKDNGNTFEELGVDSLFVDEAHNFKNLPFYSKLSRVAGVSVNQSNNKTRASRAENMFMITDYLNRSGGRITFGTATPITNSMSEIYNMMRFLRPDILADAGLQSFDAWASMFGSIVNQAEVDPSGRNMRMKERFSKFKNVSQMIEQFRRMADILKTGDVIQDLPKAERIDIINESNDIQEEFLDIIDSMIDDIRANGQNAEHNMLEVTTAGQMAAIDLRFVESYFEGKYTREDLNLPNSRIVQVAKKVYEEYTNSNSTKGTQFVFCDVGISDDPSRKYNLHVYGDLINRLEALGIPRNEIAVAQDFEDKADLSARVNTGEIRVLIGSTAVMGEGMNAQQKAVALHHMTVPARPSDIEQREGRIIRYGNENKNVRIYRYIQEKSYDSYQWQMQERKANFINQALSGGTVEELEEMSDFQLSAREAKAIASGNPLLLEKIEIEDKLNKLKSLRNKFNTDKLDMQDRLARLPGMIATKERLIAETTADAKTVADNTPADFEITLGKTKYTERAKAAEILKKGLANAPRNGTRVKVGSYRGLELYYTSSFDKGTHYILKGAGEYSTQGGDSASGNIIRIANVAEKIGVSLDAEKARVANYKAEIETLKSEVNAEFPKAKELEELQAKLNEIDTQLGINVSTVDMSDVIVDDGGDTETNYSLESEDIYERDTLSDGSGGRDIDSSSGKQAESLDRATKGTAGNFAASVRQAYTEKLTAEQIEERTAKDNKGILHRYTAIKESVWNDNMRAIADYYERRGVKVEFIKGNIQFAFVGKDYMARGMQQGDTLFVSYDNARYTPEQIAKHEYIEDNYESEDVQRAKKQILDNMPEAEYNNAIEKLKKQYEGITDSVADLEKELVCNILSGMYAGSATYTDTTTAFWAKDESVYNAFDAAQYADSIDAGGNADVIDAAGYFLSEGGFNDGRADAEGVGTDGTRQNYDSIWQRSDDSDSAYQKLGSSEEALEAYQGDGGYRYIDWSGVLANFDVLKPHDKENAYGLLRAISGLELSSTDQQGRSLTEDQKRYFAKTVAKNGNGELITLYHATNGEFDVFEFGDFGYHVGDFRQAGRIGAKFIKEVYINLESPFYVDFDDGIWMGSRIAEALLEQGVITQGDYDYFRTLEGFVGNKADSEANVAIKSLMKEKGFDGIVYHNGFETEGLSFILFDSNQIKYTSNKNPTASPKINYSLDTYEEDAATLTPEHKKEIFEQFDRDKAGIDKVSGKQVWGERAEWIAHNMTRVFPDIPERGERGAFFAEFRKMMIQWKGLASTSSFMVQDKLNKMTEGLTPEEFDTFSKLVYFLDLQEEAQIQKDKGYTEILLPNEIKPEEVDAIIEDLNKEASENVKQALVKRQEIWDDLKEKYISLNQYIGFDTDGKFKRKNYYHHQVIEYMNKEAKGTGNRDVSVKAGRSWLKERQGSTKAINTDFLAVEYKALLQMQYDVYVANMLGKIKQQYDIKPQLEKEAFNNNKELINAIIRNECTDEDGKVRLDSKGKPDSDTYRQQLWYNQRIMLGFSGLFDLADRGLLPDFDGHYSGVVSALRYQDLHVAGLYKYVGELASVELLDNATDELEQAVISARTVLKYTSQKKAWIKAVLGDDYQTWETLAKSMSDTHSIHQPRRGNYFYTKTTVDEDAFNRAFDEMIATLAAGAKGIESTDDVKQMFMQYSETVRLMGAAYEQWVLPNEIVKTIDSVANPKQASEGAKAARAIVSAWKGWATSVNPLRTVKFGLRNIFGDIDAVIAGNPRIVKHSKQAVQEIYQAMRHKKYSPEFMEWVERGGYTSMIFANEMDSEMQDKLFAHLKEKEGANIFKSIAKAFEGYYNGVEATHNFREAILRYSAYLHFKSEMQKNGGSVKDNVASNRYIVKGLHSVEDKAYQLSKDLLGAYDEVGMMGQTLRRYWMPFYSFAETNLKRYYRLFENIVTSDASVPKKAGKLLLKGLMANLLALLMLAWNKLVMGEEDDKLPPSTRNVPHITLGQIGDNVIAFRQLGSFSDILEWFGLEDYKWTSEDLTAPLDKAWGMITPFVKMPVELASGLNFYPSITEPRAIRDRAQHFFNSLGVDDVYDLITGKPTRGIGELAKGAFVYSYDYQESAYYEILDIKRNYQGKTDNTIYGTDKKSNALYYMKTAIRYNDKKAALKYLDEYFENGGTGRGVKQSFATLNPMYGYTGKDTLAKGEEFIASLTDEEKEKLKIAQTFYENELMLPEKVSALLGKKDITNEEAKNLLITYINSQCK